MTIDEMREYANDCRLLLGIGDEWHINFEIDAELTVGGEVAVHAAYLNADVRMSPAATKQHIMHEMMHIALSQLRSVAHMAMDKLEMEISEAYREMFDFAEEQTIQRISRALISQLEPADYE